MSVRPRATDFPMHGSNCRKLHNSGPKYWFFVRTPASFSVRRDTRDVPFARPVCCRCLQHCPLTVGPIMARIVNSTLKGRRRLPAFDIIYIYIIIVVFALFRSRSQFCPILSKQTAGRLFPPSVRLGPSKRNKRQNVSHLCWACVRCNLKQRIRRRINQSLNAAILFRKTKCKHLFTNHRLFVWGQQRSASRNRRLSGKIVQGATIKTP